MAPGRWYLGPVEAEGSGLVLKEAVSDINRARQILGVMVKHGFGDMLQRGRIFERLGIRRPEGDGDRGRSTAQRVTRMLTELGPTFIKMGQLLSTRPDIVPDEYVQELRSLQDQAAPFEYEQVAQVIKEELGADPEKLYKRFEREPMASASIAQVHRAVTHDGLEVVVKVRRPGIEGKVRSDLDILYYLAHLLEAVFEETSQYNPVDVVREFDQAIGFEMDLQREAENLRTFAKNFRERTTIAIPEPVDQLSSYNVLTMRCLEGKRLEEVEPGSELGRQAALNLIEGAYQQAFEDGFFHADPHPGNLRIMEDGRVGMLDFGQVGRLTPAMRNTLVLLGLGIILKDADTISRLVYRVGAQGVRVDLGSLKKDIQETLESSLESKLDRIDTGQILRRLLDLSLEHKVRIPPDYALVTKALATVEVTVRRLYPDMDTAAVAGPYIKRLLVERYNLEDLRGGLLRTVLQLSNFLNDVPQQVSQILLDLEGGRLSVQVRDPESSRMRGAVRGVGMDVFWGLVAAGLLAGSLPAIMQPGPAPSAAIAGLVGAGLIAVTATLRYFLMPIFRKVRLKPWLERRWGKDKK
jgi:ubiquinone biosynthesis protein